MRHTNHEITEAMIRFGGGFVRALGLLFRQADQDNKRRLLLAFPEYWQQYDDLAAFSDAAVGSPRPMEEQT